MKILYRGIFWIKDIENINAVVVKSRCNHNGEFIELLKPEFLSKSGFEFNHRHFGMNFPKLIQKINRIIIFREAEYR